MAALAELFDEAVKDIIAREKGPSLIGDKFSSKNYRLNPNFGMFLFHMAF